MAGKPALPTPLPPGHVRLLETEPTPEERLGHAAALLEIIKQQEARDAARLPSSPRGLKRTPTGARATAQGQSG